jgi:hypothetical protein
MKLITELTRKEKRRVMMRMREIEVLMSYRWYCLYCWRYNRLYDSQYHLWNDLGLYHSRRLYNHVQWSMPRYVKRENMQAADAFILSEERGLTGLYIQDLSERSRRQKVPEW